MPPARPTARRPLKVVVAAALSCFVLAAPAQASSPASPRPQSSATVQRQVDALNAEIARVGDELALGAVAYERAQDALARRTQGLSAASSEADLAVRRSTGSHTSFDSLARAAYKGHVPPMVAALLSGDPDSVGTLAYVQRSVDRVGARRQAEVQRHDGAAADGRQAVGRADAERVAALAAQQALERQLAALASRAEQLSGQLTLAAAQVEQARERERAEERARLLSLESAAQRRRAADSVTLPSVRGVDDGGDGCQLPSGVGEVNGFLSSAGLCPLVVGGGHRLRTDAARAFDAMDRAHVASVGTHLCVADSYRSYAGQVAIFAAKPGLAATPGRSKHGWGIAVDLCGGVQLFGSAAHGWMQANAWQFGWVHPAWAEPSGSKPEAWHWEYVGGPEPTGTYPAS